MDPRADPGLWYERSKDLLREAEQRRLARELRDARRAKRIEVRWILPGDEHKIADLLELNGRPRWEAFEERFIVAEALSLPTFEVEGSRLLRRLTLIVADGQIQEVFYPVFPPDKNAEEVVQWLLAAT